MKSRRAELVNQYRLTSTGIIITPGKFEGEPLWVPYYWEHYLNGDYDDQDEEGGVWFEVSDQDRCDFPELCNTAKVRLWESKIGFIFSDTQDIRGEHKC